MSNRVIGANEKLTVQKSRITQDDLAVLRTGYARGLEMINKMRSHLEALERLIAKLEKHTL